MSKHQANFEISSFAGIAKNSSHFVRKIWDCETEKKNPINMRLRDMAKIWWDFET